MASHSASSAALLSSLGGAQAPVILNTLLSTMQGLFVIWGPDGHPVLCSDSFREALGYSATEMSGLHLDAVIHPDELDEVRRFQAERAAGDVTVKRYMRRLRTRDRSVIHAECTSIPFALGGRVIGTMVEYRNLTDHLEAQRNLEQETARAQAIVRAVSDAIVSTDAAGIMVSVNPAAVTMFGYPEDEMVGRNVAMLMPEPDYARHDGYMERYRDTGDTRILGRVREVIARRRGGATFPARITINAVRLPDAVMFAASITDLSTQQLIDRERDLILAMSGDAIVTFGQDLGISYANPATRATLGHEPADLVGLTLIEIVAPESQEPFIEAMRTLRAQGDAVQIECAMLHADGTTREVDWRISALSPNLDRFAAVGRDVTRKKAELQDLVERGEALAADAATDALTGAANRRALDAILREQVETSRVSGIPLSLLALDVDHFKELNDQHGHSAGDAALVEVVGRIRASLRTSDLVARHGGDEFAVVMPKAAPLEALAVAERIRAAVDRLPVALPSGRSVRLTVSIGVTSLGPAAARSAHELLEAADRGLYAAKSAGKNCVRSAVLGADRAA